MANPGWTPLAKKVDLTREVQGTLAISSLDPLIQNDVTNGYNLGVTTDGVPVLEGKDTSNQLAFYRLKPGAGVTIAQQGNSVVITSSVVSGGTAGVMLTSVYDVNNHGYVDHAALADSVNWSGIQGTPATFPPSPHTHPESDIVGLSTDLANRVPTTRLVNTAFSLQGGGALNADLTISLIGDKANPGAEMRYGTDASGNLGWYAASAGVGDMSKSVYDINNNGIVDMAEAVIPGAITTPMLATGAVTGNNIAYQTIPGSALAPTAVVTSLGYTPLNKAGDTASGQIAVSMTGPPVSTNMYQHAHLLLETSGVGGGFPTIGLACLTGGANAGAVSLWYQGLHGDIQMEYQDGTSAHLLSSISALSGAQITAGTVPGSALASGAALANLGFIPIDGQHGGVYTPSGQIQINSNVGVVATSYASAPLGIYSPQGGGTRPQIGFYHPGAACSLYFEPTDVTFRYMDSTGNLRILLDAARGVSKTGDTMQGTLYFPTGNGVGPGSYAYAPIHIYSLPASFPNARPGIGFEIPGYVGVYLYLDSDGRLRYIDAGGVVRTLLTSPP